nr:hypothetical protein [Mycoplasmopsis bovis]
MISMLSDVSIHTFANRCMIQNFVYMVGCYSIIKTKKILGFNLSFVTMIIHLVIDNIKKVNFPKEILLYILTIGSQYSSEENMLSVNW